MLYNPVMTVIFINQRFDLNNTRLNINKHILFLIIFIIAFSGQFLFQFLGQDSALWLIVYFITITTLVMGDRIAKRIKH